MPATSATVPFSTTIKWATEIDADMADLWAAVRATGNAPMIATMRRLCTDMRGAATELAGLHGVSLTDIAPLSGSKPPPGS